MAPELAEGIRRFESGATRPAHEEWEDVWRTHRGSPLGEVARALSQWAAACIHLEEGRIAGFRSLAAKCASRFAGPAIAEEFETRPLADRIARLSAAEALPDPRELRALGP